MRYYPKFDKKTNMWDLWKVEKRKHRKMMSVSERIMDLKLAAWCVEQEALVIEGL